MPFDIVVGAFNIGSFFLQVFGLSQLLPTKGKDLASITEQARIELCAAFKILDEFHKYVDDDILSPLVQRYNWLHTKVKEEEEKTRKISATGRKPKPTKARRRQAKETLMLCHELHCEIRTASEDARNTKFLKEKNWTPEGKPILHIKTQPRDVASSSVPRAIKYDLRKPSSRTSYPPSRAGSLTSIVSNPFKDPPGAVPSDPDVPQSPSSPQWLLTSSAALYAKSTDIDQTTDNDEETIVPLDLQQ